MPIPPLLALAAILAQEPLIEGRRDSPVRVLIFEDLQCPDCAAFRDMLDQHLLPKYAAKVAFVHRDFPLSKHSWARRAAIAARHFEAIRPELGVAFRRYIMASIPETSDANFAGRVAAFARNNEAGPGVPLDDPRLAALVEKDLQDGVARGVSKTPTVFVNGKPFVERFTVEEISRAIDEALAGPDR